MGAIDREHETRVERDSLGEMRVPADAYYGVQTHARRRELPDQRPALPAPLHPRAGADQGRLRPKSTSRSACSTRPSARRHRRAPPRRWSTGKLDDQFVLDIFQTGSGTSTNMNANEVIASRANELLDGQLATRRGRSTRTTTSTWASPSNDVIPTAIHVAALAGDPRGPAARRSRRLERRCATKPTSSCRSSRRAAPTCRTPRRSGSGRSSSATPGRSSAADAGWTSRSRELQRGGAGRHRRRHRHQHPRRVRRARLRAALSARRASSSARRRTISRPRARIDGVVAASGALKTIAVSLIKIANDIRWLGSGPARRHRRTGAAGRPAGLLDHAGQGQPGHRRIGDDGRRPGDRQ